MADDLQAMLSTIGQKFDISFDQKQEPIVQKQNLEHQKSINPENRSESSQIIQSLSSLNIQQAQEEEEAKPFNASQLPPVQSTSRQNDIFEVPFLPLLEKDDNQQNPQEEVAEEKPAMLEGETAGPFQSQQQEIDYYRSLSEKFEDALNIAQSRKSLSTYFQGEFMERQEHYHKKKQSGLNMLQIQKEKREKRHCRGKPLINSYSQHILTHYTPIEKRYPEVLAQKKRKVQMWQTQQKKKKEEAQQEEIDRMEKWTRMIKERIGVAKSSQEYYQSQKQWSQKRYKNIEQKVNQRDQTLRSEISFKPKINKRSDNMMKKKPERVPIYEKEPQLKRLPVDLHCTFKPNLSKTLKL